MREFQQLRKQHKKDVAIISVLQNMIRNLQDSVQRIVAGGGGGGGMICCLHCIQALLFYGIYHEPSTLSVEK